MKYICKCCGWEYLELPKKLRCGCGASLWMEYPHKLQKQDIIQDDFSMWRYEAALPIKKADCVVTLGEGLTPLLRENWNGYEIWIKNESAEPTGSFKDRGIALSINDAMRRDVSILRKILQEMLALPLRRMLLVRAFNVIFMFLQVPLREKWDRSLLTEPIYER